MNIRLKRSTLVIGAAAAVVVVSSGAAVAFWTTSGSGTGTAGIGTSGTVTVTQTGTAISGLFPGGTAQPINFTVSNATTGPLYVSGVAVAVSSVTNQSSGPNACTAADFAIVQPTWTAGDIAAGSTATGTATIRMVNAGSNQDACKSATVNLAFTAS